MRTSSRQTPKRAGADRGPDGRRRLRNAYGYFDEAGGEYVITRPDTPTPWMNYIGEGRYGGIVSNTGGGYSFDRDPRNRRVTRYRYNAIPSDQPGRYVYLRDQDSGKYWSPTWQPVPERKLDAYECRHGAGYTKISGACNGIAASLLYFVPPSPPDNVCPCEVWVLRVKNVSRRARKLRAFSYVELSYYDAMTDQLNLDWGQHIFRTRHEAGTLYASTQFQPTVTFFSSSAHPVGFDSDREVFVGRGRDLSNPEVLETGKPRNTEAPRGNNIASLCHELRLAPGE